MAPPPAGDAQIDATVEGSTRGTSDIPSVSYDLLLIGVELKLKAIVPDDVTWDGTTDQSWTVGSNWDNGTGPTTGDNVFIDGAKTGTASDVTLDQAATIGKLTIDAGDTLTLAPALSYS